MLPLNPELVESWINQFKPEDHASVQHMLDEFLFIAYRDLRELLITNLRRIYNSSGNAVALYAERAVPANRQTKKILPLFSQTTDGPIRAIGTGPTAVATHAEVDSTVGSEGIVAQLITDLCRDGAGKFLNHPGPDKLRKSHVRTVVIVADFVGSGKRVWDYLEAFWQVRSIRSWYSRKLIRFEIIAYSTTLLGESRVSSHPSRPKLHIVRPCPTIDSQFPRLKAKLMKELCLEYDPVRKDRIESLGFGGVGALIGFAHGVPNNVPRMFHKNSHPSKAQQWLPLFQGRSTLSALRTGFETDKDWYENRVAQKLLASRKSKYPWLERANSQDERLSLVLVAMKKYNERPEIISLKTGIILPTVVELVERARKFGFIDAKSRLTDLGANQARSFENWQAPKNRQFPNPAVLYYPSQLRKPMRLSR